MLTVDQCRDKLAEMEGWKKKHERWYHPVWHKLGSGQKRHPIPATLDAAAAAMPEGWWWERDKRRKVWRIGPVGTDAWQKCLEDTGDEIADRFNIALLAREKGKA
jgi:hypothetical protein